MALYNWAVILPFRILINFAVRPYFFDTATSDVISLSSDLNQNGPFVPFGSRLLFSAYTTETDGQLWITDGTLHGTTPFVDLIPGQTEVTAVLAVTPGGALVGTYSFDVTNFSFVDLSGQPQTIQLRNTAIGIESTPVSENKLLVSLPRLEQAELMLVDLSSPLPLFTLLEPTSNYFIPKLERLLFGMMPGTYRLRSIPPLQPPNSIELP